MPLVEVLTSFKTQPLLDEDGNPLVAELLPGLSDEDIRIFETTLGAQIPGDYRLLLRECSGMNGLAIEINFKGHYDVGGMEEVFPHIIPFAADGYGNFWVVDCLTKPEEKAQVFFWCHDAPVILFQSDGMEEFLEELFRFSQPPNKSLIDEVHEDRPCKVWLTNPAESSTPTPDRTINAFLSELGEGWTVVDMRGCQPGYGFSWGRYGVKTELRRFGEERIFAYRKPQREPGFFARLLGRRY